jgi:hypothetical protein
MKNKEFLFKDRLTDSQIEKFKLFENEELIFACREHWLPLVFRLLQTFLLGIFMAADKYTKYVEQGEFVKLSNSEQAENDYNDAKTQSETFNADALKFINQCNGVYYHM